MVFRDIVWKLEMERWWRSAASSRAGRELGPTQTKSKVTTSPPNAKVARPVAFYSSLVLNLADLLACLACGLDSKLGLHY